MSYAESEADRQVLRIDQLIQRMDWLNGRAKAQNNLLRALLLVNGAQVLALVLILVLRML